MSRADSHNHSHRWGKTPPAGLRLVDQYGYSGDEDGDADASARPASEDIRKAYSARPVGNFFSARRAPSSSQ
jgi:hypothetical protein